MIGVLAASNDPGTSSHPGAWVALGALFVALVVYSVAANGFMAPMTRSRGRFGLSVGSLGPFSGPAPDPVAVENPEAQVDDDDRAAIQLAYDGGELTRRDRWWGHAVTVGTVVVCAIACLLLFPAGGALPWIASLVVILFGASVGRTLPHHLAHRRSVAAKKAAGDPGPHQGFFAARRARRAAARTVPPTTGYSPIS